MNKSNSSVSSGGIGFAGLLTIVFIVLKLTHVIDWSWLLILCPMWISIAVSLVLIVIGWIWVASKAVRKNKKKR